MRSPADNLRLYRWCGLAALMLTLTSGAMAVSGSPGMWVTAGIGCVEAFGFGLIVSRFDPSPPSVQARDDRDDVGPRTGGRDG